MSYSQQLAPISLDCRFTLPDAQSVILQCKDDVKFRVASVPLRMASGFFASTFSLPQSPVGMQAQREDELVCVEESSEVMEMILKLTCGRGLDISDLNTFDVMEELLYAAEKYEIPIVIAFVKAGIARDIFKVDPVRLYAICRRYGWEKEAEVARKLSLSIDVREDRFAPSLSKLDSNDLVNLLRLRWKRKQIFMSYLNDSNRFVANKDPLPCQNCGATQDTSRWRDAKAMLSEEMERHPSGDCILHPAYMASGFIKSLFATRCALCQYPAFVEQLTMTAIYVALRQLPNTL